MKVFFVTSVCRQVEGDTINIRFEKAFSDKDKAFSYAESLTKTYIEYMKIADTDKRVHNIQFCCERSVHELELEE